MRTVLETIAYIWLCGLFGAMIGMGARGYWRDPWFMLNESAKWPFYFPAMIIVLMRKKK